VGYAVKAPDDYVRALGLEPSNTGSALIDAALQCALKACTPPGVLMHAHNNGGAELMSYYEKLGFQIVSPYSKHLGPRDSKTAPLALRKNDGRYFTANRSQIIDMLNKVQPTDRVISTAVPPFG
jgi:hypothetical protein